MRWQGQYADPGAGRMQHMSGQRMEQNSGPIQEQLEAFTPEREQPYVTSKSERQWRWERDGPKVPNSVAPQMFNEDVGQGVDASRSYFQGQRLDTKLALEKQNNSDPRSRPHEDMDVGYEDKPLSQTLEGIEQKFLNDIIKLLNEQSGTEDAENARHKEKIKAINAQYEEQLAALRSWHSSRRDEYLRKESHARRQQYQQAIMDHYPNSGMCPGDPLGYSSTPAAAAVGETYRSYNSDHYDTHTERARFVGNPRDHGSEPRGPYPGGSVYATGSRYY